MGRRKFTEEFKQEAVKLVLKEKMTLSQAARDLGVSTSQLGRWVKQREIDQGNRVGLSTDERTELSRLRRRCRELEMEREILKKATAFFAKESK